MHLIYDNLSAFQCEDFLYMYDKAQLLLHQSADVAQTEKYICKYIYIDLPTIIPVMNEMNYGTTY